MCQNRYPIPFFQPGWFRYLVGGVMTPPYEIIIHFQCNTLPQGYFVARPALSIVKKEDTEIPYENTF